MADSLRLFIVCASTTLLLILLSHAFEDKQDTRHKRDTVNSTEIPTEHIDPAAIDLTPLVNTLINSSQSGSRQLFSLLSVTSYSSLALHKLTLLVYNVSSIRAAENKLRRRFCYCITNETNDLTDFTAILLDVMGNSTSYLQELFKSASILSVNQRNNSDCIYICVMAGRKGREMSELWEVDSITPLFNQTIVEGPHRDWQRLPTNVSHIPPSGTSSVHSTAHAAGETTTTVNAAELLLTAPQPPAEVTQSPATEQRAETQPATATVTTPPMTSRLATSQPMTSRLTTSQPMTSRLMTSRPMTSQLMTSRPTTSQPMTSRLTTSQPMTSRLMTSQPMTSQLMTSRLTTSQLMTSRLMTSQPMTSQPMTSRLMTSWPMTSQLMTSRLTTSQPMTSRLMTSQPMTSQLMTSRLTTSQLMTSRLMTSQPMTSQLMTSQPMTSQLMTSRLTTSQLMTSRLMTTKLMTSRLTTRTTASTSVNGPDQSTAPSQPDVMTGPGPTRLSPEGPAMVWRTTGPPLRRTTTPSRPVEKPGCPWRRLELTDVAPPGGGSTTTVGAHKLQPCVLELCKFFSQCLCRPFSARTPETRYCDDHVWYEKHTSEVCRRVRRVSFSRNLKQRCLTKMCSKL